MAVPGSWDQSRPTTLNGAEAALGWSSNTVSETSTASAPLLAVDPVLLAHHKNTARVVFDAP